MVTIVRSKSYERLAGSQSCRRLASFFILCRVVLRRRLIKEDPNGNPLRSCTLRKQICDAKEARKAYETNRSDSRTGVDLTPEELQRLDDIISPLIRQGQSIHQICVNNADDIMCDERSIYNYVDAGILSVANNHTQPDAVSVHRE